MAKENVGRAGWAMGMTLIGKMALWNAYDKEHADSAAFWFQTGIDALEKVAQTATAQCGILNDSNCKTDFSDSNT